MKKQNFVTPKDFRKVDKKKRLNNITRLFFVKCSNIDLMFTNGKISKDFMKLRCFMGKQKELTVNYLYDYLIQLEPTPMTLTDVFVNAEKYLSDQKFIAGEEKKVLIPKYEKSLLDTLMEME